MHLIPHSHRWPRRCLVQVLRGKNKISIIKNTRTFVEISSYLLLSFCEWKPPVTSGFPSHKKVSNAESISMAIGLVQERRNSIANALELRLSCTNPSMLWCHHGLQLSISFGWWFLQVYCHLMRHFMVFYYYVYLSVNSYMGYNQ